ncbi:enoyl-CoA hydratase/carnithine racemase [Amanita rubescens]|nr:enoyl-CoA hydratase/carnithine racemase [Amanita rubescens]
MSSLDPPSPPSVSDELRLDFPAEHVLLLTLNRPWALNAMTPTMAHDLGRVLNWFEGEPRLWVAVVTGAGRLFCAGADLKAWNERTQNGGETNEQEHIDATLHGFGSISRRISSKPIVAAVIGGAYGGGMEMLVNCDIIVASSDAKFSFPEVKRGVVAVLGGIPRIARICGHQFASELLLLGKTVGADEAQTRFGFVNTVVPADKVLSTAIDLAKEITRNSPDAVQSTKVALLLAQKYGVEEAFRTHVWSLESKRVYEGDNIKEGLRAFVEKRAPKWTNPAKL